jgi:hypothetical protein
MIAKSFFVGMFSITLSVLFSVLPSFADSKTTSGFDYDSENSFEHDSARNSDFHTLRLSVKGMENAGAGVLRVLFSNSEDAFEKSIRSSDDSICKDSEGMSDSVQLVWPKDPERCCHFHHNKRLQHTLPKEHAIQNSYNLHSHQAPFLCNKLPYL